MPGGAALPAALGIAPVSNHSGEAMSAESTDYSATLTRFRAAMPIASRLAYFDHAAVAPLPGPTRESIRRWLDQATDEGDLVWAQWARRIEEVRGTAARLINARPHE